MLPHLYSLNKEGGHALEKGGSFYDYLFKSQVSFETPLYTKHQYTKHHEPTGLLALQHKDDSGLKLPQKDALKALKGPRKPPSSITDRILRDAEFAINAQNKAEEALRAIEHKEPTTADEPVTVALIESAVIPDAMLAIPSKSNKKDSKKSRSKKKTVITTVTPIVQQPPTKAEVEQSKSWKYIADLEGKLATSSNLAACSSGFSVGSHFVKPSKTKGKMVWSRDESFSMRRLAETLNDQGSLAKLPGVATSYLYFSPNRISPDSNGK